MELHDGIEAGESGGDHLRAAAEPGEEVRFDESGGDAHVRFEPRAVQPNGDAARRFAGVLQRLGVERAVVDDAIAACDVGAEHLIELFGSVGTVGSRRYEDGDLIVRDVGEFPQERGQDGLGRHGASDVADGDGDRLGGLDQPPEAGASAEGIAERVANGGLLVGEAGNVGRFDDGGYVVGEIDFEAVASVCEVYDHRQSLSSSWQNSTHWTSSEMTTYSRSVCML